MQNDNHFVQASMCQLIEAEWHIYASVQHTNIGSDNGLSPFGTKPLSEPIL